MTDYFGRLPRNSSRGICVLKKSKRFIPNDNSDNDEEEGKKCFFFSEKNGAEQQGSKRLIPKTTMTMMKNIPHEDGEKMLLGEKWSEAAGAEPLIVWPPIRS